MRINLSDYSSHATNTVGVRFDTSPIAHPPLVFDGFELPAHIKTDSYITDTTDWVLFSREYIAEGGEEYLTIGRFIDTNTYSNFNIPSIEVVCDSCFSGQNTAYYYIDSVTLISTNAFITDEKIPNVLTANDDNVNDYWYPHNICFSNWTCTIINRWGEEVFAFGELDMGWNGKDRSGNDLIEGVYHYFVNYFVDKKEHKRTGFIHLVR